MVDGKGGFSGPSLRGPTTSTSGNRSGVAEGLRDLEAVVKGITQVKKISRINQIYAPPFYLGFPFLPFAVVLGRAKNAKSPTYTSASFIGWQWDKSSIRVDEITGLIVGEPYDLNFLVFG